MEHDGQDPLPQSQASSSLDLQSNSSSLNSMSPTGDHVSSTAWNTPPVDTTPILASPQHLLMRSRRISSPIFRLSMYSQSSTVSEQLEPSASAGGSERESNGAKNRFSVASSSSLTSNCSSLPEEGEDSTVLIPNTPIRQRKYSTRSSIPLAHAEVIQGKRLSMASVMSSSSSAPSHRHSGLGRSSSKGRASPLSRSTSSLIDASEAGKENVFGPQPRLPLNDKDLHEQAKKTERRLRLAEELRDTERAYTSVLENIDMYYYQPLLAAVNGSDSPDRRMSVKTSGATAPRRPLSQPPIRSASVPFEQPDESRVAADGWVVSRRIIADIFSNFTDVLNLSSVMLSVLEDAVPTRPSRPVTLVTEESATFSTRGSYPESPESDTSGPAGGKHWVVSASNESAPLGAARPRRRATSVRSIRHSGHDDAPPSRLGQSLLPVLPFLKQCSLFIAQFSTSITRLADLEQPVAAPLKNGGVSRQDRARWSAFCEQQRRRQAEDRGSSINQLGLSAMLLNIVQRVPRYKLLLSDIKKYTEVEHQDWPYLARALELVEGVASHLESQIEAHTASLALLNLQRALGASLGDKPNLMAPGRHIVRFDRVRKLDRKGQAQDRVIVLLNDELLVCTSNKSSVIDSQLENEEQLVLRQRSRLADITVLSAESTGIEVGQSYNCAFEVRTAEKSFIAFTASPRDRSAWLDAVRNAKDVLLHDRTTLTVVDDPTRPSVILRRERRMSLPAPRTEPVSRLDFKPTLPVIPPTPLSEETVDPFVSTLSEGKSGSVLPNEESIAKIVYPVLPLSFGYSAPVWMPDSDPRARSCMICSETFSIWRRRHHCRLCGGIACNSCSNKWFVIPPSDGTDPARGRLSRACLSCFSSVFERDVPISDQATGKEGDALGAAPDRYATRRHAHKFNTVTRKALLESSITLLRSPDFSVPRPLQDRMDAGHGGIETDVRLGRKSSAVRRLESILGGTRKMNKA